MVSSPIFRSPIVNDYPAASADKAIGISDESGATKTIVRGATDSAAADSIKVSFGTSRAVRSVLLAGTRPDEWLVLGHTDAAKNYVDRLSLDGHVSIVDWTHGRAMFRLTGDMAAAALEKVCGLDLADNMTPNGAVTSASVAKVGCDLIRNDADGERSYLILCDRSFGQYLFDALIDACEEFGVGIGAAR